jgi:hypothetical protein
MDHEDSSGVGWWAAAGDVYDCDYPAIQATWADTYDSCLDGQFVDVTGVLPGDCKLKVHVNYDKVLAESDCGNNTVEVDVTIPGCLGPRSGRDHLGYEARDDDVFRAQCAEHGRR